MSVRLAALAVAALAVNASAALAADDQPVATGRAQPAPAAQPSAADDPVAQLEAIPGWGDPGPDKTAPDRKAHGYVSVGVGSRGYREMAAGVVAPVGKDGTVALDVSTVSVGGTKTR